MTFAHLVCLLFGLASAMEVYPWVAKRFKKPSRIIIPASPLRGQIESFEKYQLEVEGKVVPALESAGTSASNDKASKSSTLARENHARWSDNKSSIPFIRTGVQLLESLAALSATNLDIEGQHDVDVLSNQTNELLTNYVSTPEAIRSMPAVEEALVNQLHQIQESIDSIQSDSAERMVRELTVGTGFLKAKFPAKR